ncbi:DUF2939 domain-containing protein [Acinetobacter faecalis]|uniref:DUF2939 domain-containing protein n=1 Tax=Acinetobacter faecalis TaxID=2665161 RepID=UPI002A90E305|nr:DUF2939 domain-containing protein [Acinetobacter faecalis]MDY6468668.1 DUF2939 domain-containing protein [Acinetobacter faecalis]
MAKKITYMSIGLLILLILGYLFFSPYIVLNKIKNSIQANNSEAISTYVDFPSVRQNLKDLVKQEIQKEQKNSNQLEKDPFAELGTQMAIVMIDKFIDAAITPENLPLVLKGQKIADLQLPNDLSKNKHNADSSKNVFNYETSYKSFNQFQIDIKDENSTSPSVSVVMTRNGLSWKITEIIPHDNKEKSNLSEPQQVKNIEKTKEVIKTEPEAPKVKYKSLIITDTEIGNGDFHLSDPATYNGHAIFYLTPAGMDNILEQAIEYPDALGYLQVEKAYKFNNNYVLVISTGENGLSCPATTYVIGYDSTSHSVTGSKKMDSCTEDSIETLTDGNKLTVKKDDEVLTFYNANVN